jgi:antitoxin component of MazEF toxin-antitoxin module
MEVQVMGYLSRIQVIERKGGSRQFYIMCPSPLAEALEIQKGEQIDWVVQDKYTIEIRRQRLAKVRKGEPHER